MLGLSFREIALFVKVFLVDLFFCLNGILMDFA